jgi:hypothetical protein
MQWVRACAERAIRGANERDIVMDVTAVGDEVVSDHGSFQC